MSMYEYAGTQEMRCVKIFRICILMVCVLSFLSGCAGSVALTKKDRSSLQTVAINKDVTKPDDMFYQGRKQSVLAGTFGLIGFCYCCRISKRTQIDAQCCNGEKQYRCKTDRQRAIRE